MGFLKCFNGCIEGNLGKMVDVKEIADDGAAALGIDPESAKEALAEQFEDVASGIEEAAEDAGVDEGQVEETAGDADEDEGEVEEAAGACSEQIEDAMAEKAGDDAVHNSAALMARVADEGHEDRALNDRFVGIQEQLAALAERVRVLETSRGITEPIAE